MPKNSQSFVKGDPRAGRTPGATNYLTRTVKETVLMVFNEIQDDPDIKLSQFAKDFPRDFYAIAAKLIPTEVNAQISAQVNLSELPITFK